MPTVSKAHSASRLLDNKVSFSKDKWPWPESDHRTPPTAEITLNLHPHIFAERGP